MKGALRGPSVAGAILFGFVNMARADIPVIDSTNLDQHSQIQGHTNQTRDIQTSTIKNTKGIDCSVHQGGKNADAKDSATAADKSGADAEIKRYGGDPLSGNNASQATDAAGRSQIGQVIGQQNATAQDVKEGAATLRSLSQKIGSSQTLKGAFDQNSVIATQNGMEFNGAIKTATAWVQAINTINVMNTAQQSGSATVMSSTTMSSAGPSCAAGTVGQGTDARPCRTKACETVQLGQVPDPDCIEVRTRDSYNHVSTYLLTVEDAADFQTRGIVFNQMR